MSPGSDAWPPRRISELLDAAAGSGPWDPHLAVAIERTSAALSAEERAVVGRFLERAVATIVGEAAQLERGPDEEDQSRK